MFRVVRALACVLLVTAVSGGCSSSPTEAKPLAGGKPLDVALEITYAASMQGVPHVSLRPTAGGIVVEYSVASGACMLADVHAERAGDVIAVWLHRYGNPLALCTANLIAYKYVATATGLSRDTYEVRFIDQVGDDPGHELGRGLVTVSSGT